MLLSESFPIWLDFSTRNGITGVDLNRCWLNPHKALHPEIYYTKVSPEINIVLLDLSAHNLQSLVAYAIQNLQHPCFAYVDIHGHSRKKYFFLYGCNPKLSWNKKDRKLEDATTILRVGTWYTRGKQPVYFLKFRIYRWRCMNATLIWNCPFASTRLRRIGNRRAG